MLCEKHERRELMHLCVSRVFCCVRGIERERESKTQKEREVQSEKTVALKCTQSI